MNKGFTLLELLVVVAVIGMLAALSLPNFMAARERARDSQKKSDLVQIQKSLELYRQDQALPAYPAALPAVGTCWSSGGSGTPCPAGNVYMNKIPGTAANPYYYSYVAATLSYTLQACLENSADPSGLACLGGYACTSNKCYIVTQP